MQSPPTDPIEALAQTSSFADVERALRGEPVSLSLRHATPEMDYFVACAELRRDGQPRHALEHLAALLSSDPSRADWRALVDEAEQRYGNLLPLLEPEGEQRYFALEALRAQRLIQAGAYEEGARLLTAIARARPDVRYLDALLLPVLARDGIASVSDDALMRVFGVLVDGCPEHDVLPVKRFASIAGWARIALAVLERSATHEPVLSMMAAGLCRRAGWASEALALLKRAPRSWPILTARALVHRYAGRVDEAVATFALAGELDASDLSWMLEAGDALYDAQRWSEAHAMYERVLARQPGHPWAQPSSWVCAARMQGERLPAVVFELESQGNVRARMLADEVRPWLGEVPPPSDALAAAILGATNDRLTGCTSTDVEAPSNLLLFRALFGDAPFSLHFTSVARPDPREPVAPIAVQRRAAPARAPGAAARSDRAHRAPRAHGVSAPALVGRGWTHRERAGGDASRGASGCRHSSTRGAQERAGRRVDRPRPARERDVLAQLAPSEPWEGSLRRSGLYCLLHGPMDWSTSAAVVALTHVAEDDPTSRTDIHRAFARLLLAMPDSGAVCWLETLLNEWLSSEGLFPAEREALRARLAALYGD